MSGVINYDLFGNPVVLGKSKAKTATPNRRPKTNPNQMYLFATGKELMKHVAGSVDLGSLDMDKLWAYKEHESKEWGYPERFLKEGIVRPVTIWHDSGHPDSSWGPGNEFHMGQGHHRVATSAYLEREQGEHLPMPVVYSEDYNFTGAENQGGDYSWEYPYGPEGRHHETARRRPMSEWLGVDLD